MRALRDVGLSIPHDISVIGIDNIEQSFYVEPPLTTLAQPFVEMGELAGAEAHLPHQPPGRLYAGHGSAQFRIDHPPFHALKGQNAGGRGLFAPPRGFSFAQV